MTTDNKNKQHQSIPQFSLYGEDLQPPNAEFVHIEFIATRSRLYDWHIGRHTHSGLFQVLFLLSGHVSAEIDGTVHECDGPVAITIHPSVIHGFTFSAEAQGFVLTVDQHLIFSNDTRHQDASYSDIFASLFVQPLTIDLTPAPAIRARLEALLEQLLAESAWPLAGHTLMLEWLARSALLLLVRAHADHTAADRNGRHDFELFSRFRSLVETHYKAQLPVNDYAARLFVTPSRLNRLCLKLSGESAFDMTQQRLILEACRKLTYLSSSIASIAYELGFQDPAYFSRLFKRHTGQTPKAFREKSTASSPIAAHSAQPES
jgi:AraC family transcriptional activator of pobA